jgi:hypothetical protein
MADEPETSTVSSTYAQSRQALFEQVMRAAEVTFARGLEAHDRIVYQIGQGHGYVRGWTAIKPFSALLLERPPPRPMPGAGEAV